MTKLIQTYYISTGRLNAMFTLRCRRDAEGQAASMYQFMPDFYLCNLAATEEKAIAKARGFVEAMRERIGEREDFKIQFDEQPDQEVYKRRGKLSVRETKALEDLESGVFPFGKYAFKKISEAPESYLLFFADKLKDATDVVTSALAAACMGEALNQGLIAKREARREEQAAQDALSEFVGTIGKRQDFEGEVYMSFQKRDPNYPECAYWINKIRCGNDIVVYIGSKSLGEKGQVIRFRGTVKSHDEYKGVRSTKISRPS